MSAAHGRLARTLGVTDTWAIATGAMFSSGFFLLPGLAAAETGSSVVLAYLCAGLLMIPPMLCQAELATAMPRAGGAYYFIDRALGPLAGAVGGVSAWIALVLKSAFALVGLGAYLAILVDVPIAATAAGMGIAFTLLNLRGADHASSAQRWLVIVLVGTLTVFVAAGAMHAFGPARTAAEPIAWSTAEFLTNGWGGFAATVGLVSVSYAGLTKVASVAEEVRDPDRSLPVGMILALVTATALYVAGVSVLLAVMPQATLFADLAPVGSAAEVVFTGGWAMVGRGIVIAAAVAAFVSTANAGVLAAARYPFAMGRDRLAPEALSRLSKSGVPVAAVLVTGSAMVFSILALDVASLAKLASAVALLLYGGIGVSVIVMREARLDGYHPGFRSPLYPFMPLATVAISLALLVAMGIKPIAFALTLVAVGATAWAAFGRTRAHRRGAILHVFRRLGAAATPGVERELGAILAERALEDGGRRTEMTAHVDVTDRGPWSAWAHRPLRSLHLPAGVLVVLVERDGDVFVPTGDDLIEPSDRLTLVGRPEALERALDQADEAAGVSDTGSHPAASGLATA